MSVGNKGIEHIWDPRPTPLPGIPGGPLYTALPSRYTIDVSGQTSEGRSYTLSATGTDPEALEVGVKRLEAALAQEPLVAVAKVDPPKYRGGSQ